MPRTTAIFFGSSNSTRSYRPSGTRQALGGARSTLGPTSSWADSGLALPGEHLQRIHLSPARRGPEAVRSDLGGRPGHQRAGRLDLLRRDRLRRRVGPDIQRQHTEPRRLHGGDRARRCAGLRAQASARGRRDTERSSHRGRLDLRPVVCRAGSATGLKGRTRSAFRSAVLSRRCTRVGAAAVRRDLPVESRRLAG